MPKSVTIKDIAAEAGVSIALVSFDAMKTITEAIEDKIPEIGGKSLRLSMLNHS